MILNKVNTIIVLMLWSVGLCAQEFSGSCKDLETLIAAEKNHAERKISLAAKMKKTASSSIDVVYHRCEWFVNPEVKQIEGTVTTYFVAKEATDRVVFDLRSENMEVLQVSRNATNLVFEHKDNALFIQLNNWLPKGTMDSLAITYKGKPSGTGFGSFMQTKHAGVPVVWTLSEPYGAMDWWPCHNGLEDKIDSLDVLITCPVAYKGISNGLRINEQISEDVQRRTIHWRHRYPIATYLVCLAVTNYEEFNRQIPLGDQYLLMQTFCYPESLASFQEGTYAAIESMQLLYNLIGSYPFIKEKYGHTQFSWGGGMEHQTNSFMANAGASLTAHELAHQWFGDKITCGSWQDIWLNEGFATHLASVYMENKVPESTLIWRKNEIEQITADTGGSVKVTDTMNINRVFNFRLTYLKASHLLYMLRFKLGDEVFFKSVKAYQNDPKLVHGYARTRDLKMHLEQVSKQKLDSFFRQWYEAEGYPSYHIQWAQISNSKVKIKLQQKTAHSSVSFFQMPVALQFKNSTISKTVVVDAQYNDQIFLQDIGFVADTVIIDPEYWLISRNNSSEKLEDLNPDKANVLLYPNPVDDELMLQIKNFKGTNVNVQCFDLAGKKVFDQNVLLYKGKTFLSIQASHWAKGKYLIRIIGQGAEANTLSFIKK